MRFAARPPACRPGPRGRWWWDWCWASRTRRPRRPARRRGEPVSRSSFHSMPGSRKWTWVSITPGMTVRPRRRTPRRPRPGTGRRPWRCGRRGRRRRRGRARRGSPPRRRGRSGHAGLSHGLPCRCRRSASRRARAAADDLGGRQVLHVVHGQAEGRVNGLELLEAARAPHGDRPGAPHGPYSRSSEGPNRPRVGRRPQRPDA